MHVNDEQESQANAKVTINNENILLYPYWCML